jgi:hypothetical protein
MAPKFREIFEYHFRYIVNHLFTDRRGSAQGRHHAESVCHIPLAFQAGIEPMHLQRHLGVKRSAGHQGHRFVVDAAYGAQLRLGAFLRPFDLPVYCMVLLVGLCQAEFQVPGIDCIQVEGRACCGFNGSPDAKKRLQLSSRYSIDLRCPVTAADRSAGIRARYERSPWSGSWRLRKGRRYCAGTWHAGFCGKARLRFWLPARGGCRR